MRTLIDPPPKDNCTPDTEGGACPLVQCWWLWRLGRTTLWYPGRSLALHVFGPPPTGGPGLAVVARRSNGDCGGLPVAETPAELLELRDLMPTGIGAEVRELVGAFQRWTVGGKGDWRVVRPLHEPPEVGDPAAPLFELVDQEEPATARGMPRPAPVNEPTRRPGA